MSAQTIERAPTEDREQIERMLAHFEYTIDEVMDKALSYNVCSQWSAEEAMNLIAKVRSFVKKIEEARKKINEPHRKAMTYTNEKVKPFTDKLEGIEKILMEKINVWKQRQDEEERRLEEEAQMLKNSLDLAITPYVAREGALRTTEALAYQKTQWKFEVECLSEVPRQYLMVDEDKIEGALKAGIREIPGLKIYEEKKTIIRSR